MSWPKTLLVWMMLAVMPSASVRVICIPEAPSSPTLQGGDALDCQTMCSAHSPHVKSRCVLVEDPSCAFALGSTTAVMPHEPVLSYMRTAEPIGRTGSSPVLLTTLAPSSPPPKG